MPLLEHRWRVVVERIRQRIISAAADRSPRLPDSERAAGLSDHGGGVYASDQLNEATHKVGVLMSMGKPLNPKNQSPSEGQASFSVLLQTRVLGQINETGTHRVLHANQE
mgnify:CR=1 FL=1